MSGHESYGARRPTLADIYMARLDECHALDENGKCWNGGGPCGPGCPRLIQCGNQDTTADGELLTCDLSPGHDGAHSCVVVREQRMSWLADARDR